MGGREGGKVAYKKQPKKETKELDEADLEFKKKQKEEAQKVKELQDRAKKGGPLGGSGIKKSNACYLIAMVTTIENKAIIKAIENNKLIATTITATTNQNIKNFKDKRTI